MEINTELKKNSKLTTDEVDSLLEATNTGLKMGSKLTTDEVDSLLEATDIENDLRYVVVKGNKSLENGWSISVHKVDESMRLDHPNFPKYTLFCHNVEEDGANRVFDCSEWSHVLTYLSGASFILDTEWAMNWIREDVDMINGTIDIYGLDFKKLEL